MVQKGLDFFNLDSKSWEKLSGFYNDVLPLILALPRSCLVDMGLYTATKRDTLNTVTMNMEARAMPECRTPVKLQITVHRVGSMQGTRCSFR